AEHLERGEVSADHGLVRGDALARGRGDQSVRRERRPQPATDGFLLIRRRVDEEHAVAVGLREAPGEPLIRHYEFALERTVRERADDAEREFVPVVAGHLDLAPDRRLEHPLRRVLFAEHGYGTAE